eukprot:TRINITY_DN7416_c0_g2_i1.p1 TRINITY_DN7416_c0_g2~~TRINITY_DN7416_c0_g2_i1.p1  ORF type:complete len:630 (-),score=136.31 TRINITY_DN7416_c0_g2_i1:21-1910(-)
MWSKSKSSGSFALAQLLRRQPLPLRKTCTSAQPENARNLSILAGSTSTIKVRFKADLLQGSNCSVSNSSRSISSSSSSSSSNSGGSIRSKTVSTLGGMRTAWSRHPLATTRRTAGPARNLVTANSFSGPGTTQMLAKASPPSVVSAEVEPLPLDQLGALVQRLKSEGEAPQEAVQWMEDTLATMKQDQIDRAALLKRSWSDSPFEDGESGNENTLQTFERELVTMLKTSSRGLADGQVLGNAIDLAGAYKKNYKLEKSEAVLLQCTRHAEDRSGAWMVKYLNHMSQVRMKQSRDVEALEMMYEIESLASFPLDEPGASEFYETLYRNMSSALRRMGREDEAALYWSKMAEASKYHKEQLDWMDLWDLGILIANRAYHDGRWPEFYKSRDIIAEALRQQRVVEPHEHILRAKVLSNLGQCYLATGEHEEAETYYSEAYELFANTVGKSSPLFGMQAWACGNLRCAEGRHREALPLLGEALYVETVKDGISISEISKLMDQILMCLHEARSHDLDDVEANLEPIQRALFTLGEDRRWEELEDTLDLAVLAHKLALVHVAARWTDSRERHTAKLFNGRSVEVLQKLMPQHGNEAKQWLVQAEAIQIALGAAMPSFSRPRSSVSATKHFASEG